MKLTKLLVAVATSFALVSAASAKETITVVNPSNKASPATVFAKSYEEALRTSQDKFNVEFYQASSCADADRKLASTPNAVMVYNADVAIANKAKGASCNFSLTGENTVMITNSYLKFCRLPGSTKAFGDEKTTVGIASVILSKGLFDDLNGGKRNLVGVPYSGSKTVLAALLAGDIDYGIIGAGVVNAPLKAGKVECVYDYDPRQANFIGNTLKGMKVPTLPITQAIFHNSSNADVAAAIAAAGKDAKFIAGIEHNGFSDTKNEGVNQADVDKVAKHVENVYNHYWK